MQKQKDDIDILIQGSKKDFVINDNYNTILLSKIKEREQKRSVNEIFSFNKSSLQISAASLIMGGLIILLLGLPGIQYKLIDYQYRIKNAEAFMQYNYHQDIIKYFKGE